VSKFYLYFVLLFVVCHCASVGKQFDTKKIDQIQTCKTTEAELVEWFGDPYQRGNQNGAPTMQWLYVYMNGLGGHETQGLAVALNSRRVVVNYQYNSQAALNTTDICPAR